MEMRILIGLVLLSSSALAQQPARWILAEEWRVGGDVDGAHSFADTRGMALLPDGRIAIIDYKDAQLHILDSKGQKVRTVGRKGAGPGEFDRPNGLAINSRGEIIVNDPVGNNRFTIFASNGDFIRTIPILNRWGYSYVWDAYFNAAGLLDEYVSIRRPGETASMGARRIWSSDFAGIDTITPPVCPNAPTPPRPEDTRFQFGNASGNTIMGIPYLSPRVPAVRGQDGSRWTAFYPDYSKIVHIPAGKCEPGATVTLRGARIPIPRAARDSVIAGVKASAARYGSPDPDFGKIPTAFTHFDALFLDSVKRLWVERPTTDPRRRRFEVYSPTGNLIAETEIATPIASYRPVIITENRILGFVSDEDGLMYLVSLRITPAA